jgi:predicted HAD superfamily Cof-like phosphohydrolase
MLTPYTDKDLFWKTQDSKLEMVNEFNKSFNIKQENNPSLISKDKFELKFNLMQEELIEYKEACENKNLVEVADAIVDMMYVLYGFITQHGLSNVFYDLFEEVHKSNMSKLERGKPLFRSDGKVIKGSEYFKPNLKNIIDGGNK